MALKCLRALILIGVFCIAAGSALAQTDNAERSTEIAAANEALTSIRNQIFTSDLRNPSQVSEDLRKIRDGSRKRLDIVERQLADVRAQLALLGPPPDEGEAPEAEDLGAKRAALNAKISSLASQRTRINANIQESTNLLSEISVGRIQSLYKRLGERGASPLAPDQWRAAFASFVATSGRIGDFFVRWSNERQHDNALVIALGLIVGAVILFLFLFGPVVRWLEDTFAHAIEKQTATPARRVAVAGVKMLSRAAPGLIGGAIIIEALRSQDIITEKGEPAANALWLALVAYLLVSGFLKGLFSPRNQNWRIAHIESGRANAISNLIVAIVITFGFKMLFAEICAAAGSGPELIRLIEATSALLISGFLFALCRQSLWRKPILPDDANKTATSGNWRLVRRLGRAAASLMGLAALTGFVDLADFTASRIYYLALILAFAWFARALVLEGALALRRKLSSDKQTEDSARARSYQFWVGLLINTVLFIALTPLLLMLAGMQGAYVQDLAQQAIFGFTIGGVRIPSLVKFASALLTVIIVLAATKFIQRGVEKGPLAHSRIDSGVQNSLITLIGYAGLVLGIFAGVSALGFDLGNLALIAGALSVGIGFGLQSIVNNFVSGLILLFERPIKVGDWIVTPSGEGTVKKISVRATEIETFDRSSIIIPNSELISSTVTNWTHKNKMGRVIIPVGVAYRSDPELVKAVLLKCAKEHPLVLNYPEPVIVWNDFGSSSLDFDLRCFLADISNRLTVATQLRFAIFKALAEAGIEIPFPQRDLHVKSLPADFSAGKKGEGDA